MRLARGTLSRTFARALRTDNHATPLFALAESFTTPFDLLVIPLLYNSAAPGPRLSTSEDSEIEDDHRH